MAKKKPAGTPKVEAKPETPTQAPPSRAGHHVVGDSLSGRLSRCHLRGQAHHAQQERAKLVRQVIARGAAELTWSTRYEVDYGLRWDTERQVWVATDGFAYASPERTGQGAA